MSIELRCDGVADCAETVSHIDDKGYAYCAGHGARRQMYGRCRKLRTAELRTLQRGEPLARY